MFNCKAISFNRMQICLAKSNHTIETNGEKNLLLSLDIRLRATHTHKYAESNFIDLTHKWKKIIYVCNLEKTILNCTNEKEK